MKKPKLETTEQLKSFGRAHARKLLAEALRGWEHCWIVQLPEPGRTGRMVYVMRGKDQIVAQFRLAAPGRKPPPPAHALVRTLLAELQVQASVANYAVVLAKQELRLHDKRKKGSAISAEQRKREAAKRDAELIVEAKKMRGTPDNQSLSKSELARRMVERNRAPGPHGLRKRLSRASRRKP